ncbi:putative uncharacterized protein DDB_G0290521 [Triticum dicoccoides]|uniref:putative uncharacterized protein DDB_G0290521 n=1 Tax=Triticum dicoccoides TaxID=85692 RepID=UPI00188F3749|nr:putative uncharacterized protein DDB_G0290521 [Triticum dicoccoides]
MSSPTPSGGGRPRELRWLEDSPPPSASPLRSYRQALCDEPAPSPVPATAVAPRRIPRSEIQPVPVAEEPAPADETAGSALRVSAGRDPVTAPRRAAWPPLLLRCVATPTTASNASTGGTHAPSVAGTGTVVVVATTATSPTPAPSLVPAPWPWLPRPSTRVRVPRSPRPPVLTGVRLGIASVPMYVYGTYCNE